jgi:hypothetical protein
LWCGVSTGSVALFWMFALPSRIFRARGIKVKFGASHFVAFDTDSYSRSPSRAMRTARSQTSGGYFFGKFESFHQKGNDIKPGTVRGGRFSSLCAPPLFGHVAQVLSGWCNEARYQRCVCSDPDNTYLESHTMTAPDVVTTKSPARDLPAVSPATRRAYAIFIGFTVLFIFLQSVTAGNFIKNGIPGSGREIWTNIHGLLAYPTMVFALGSTAIAIRGLRGIRGLVPLTGILFLATVAQWLTGHMISTLGLNWVTPYHVVLAFVIYGLAIVLSVRSAALRRMETIAAERK